MACLAPESPQSLEPSPSFFPEKRQLGASFFFKGGDGERVKAGKFFTTITLHLMDWMPAIRPHVGSAIDEDSKISPKSPEQQFKKLILEPLSKARGTSKEISTLIIEGEEKGHIKTIV